MELWAFWSGWRKLGWLVTQTPASGECCGGHRAGHAEVPLEGGPALIGRRSCGAATEWATVPKEASWKLASLDSQWRAAAQQVHRSFLAPPEGALSHFLEFFDS